MIEVIIEGINYCLNEENLTAQVIRNPERCYTGEFVVPETVVWENVSYQVTSIGSVDFVEYGIDKVVIPATITSIAIRTLYNRFLKDLTYMGTKAQWAKVQRPKQWLGDIQVVHCTDGDIVKKDEMLAEIEPTLQKIKKLMQEKNFQHFYIPDQYDCRNSNIDEYFEDEIWDDDLNLFAGYSHHEVWVRYTIDGIYLENDELMFDIRSNEWYDDTKDPGSVNDRMGVNEVVELAAWYEDYDRTLPPVLEFYIQLLNRYNHEDAYIEYPA